MIIEKVVLKDFGIYGGRNEFVLLPVSPSKPIILFGGLNGSGKTTFLDAVQLALYGKQARCSNRSDLPYDIFLREAIHRGADTAVGAAIEIHFRRTSDGNEHHFALTRSWANTGKSIREHIKVVQDGMLNKVLSDSWAEYIEAYLPNRIANLFFFDGEQIKELAESDNAAEILKTAINSLLGLDIVDRLTSDLLVVERRKRLAAKNDLVRQKLLAMQAECEKLQSLQETATHDCAEAQNIVERLQKHLTDLELMFRQEGGELLDRKHEFKAEHDTLKVDIQAIEDYLRELAAGPLPLILLETQLEYLERQIAAEVSYKESQILLALLEQRDGKILRLLTKLGSLPKTMEAVGLFLQSDRHQIETANEHNPILNADTHTLETIRTLRRLTLPNLRDDANVKIAQLSEVQCKVDLLDGKLAQVPHAEAISGIKKELEETRMTLREARARLDTLEAKKDLIERELSSKRSAYSRELESDEYVRIQKDDDARILIHSSRVRETLTRFLSAATARRIKQLERLILDSFVQLIRKEQFLSSITINPTDFSVTLIAADGHPLPVARLSAGERQLLATAMLWGLARASGRTVPTIIDTPLGRLDSSHRAHLVQRYFPVASHQVILLSTDEEIDECHLERLKPYHTRSYRLEYDNKRRTTIAQEGYFWK